MSSRSAAFNASDVDGNAATDGGALPTVVLKGNKGGLEIQVDGSASVAHIGDSLTTLLGEAPKFFAGCQARVRVHGKLPAGALARLEDVTARFDLSIVEVGPFKAPVPEAVVAESVDGVPQPQVAGGSSPIAGHGDSIEIEIDAAEGPASDASPTVVMPALAPPDALALAPGARLFVGPVRSGAVLEARGHLVILGDVNPGAEVRAEGNILVLGRMRGIAHAAVGGEAGFILALRLEPQQVRIGRLVARAGAGDTASDGVELAYATGKTIVIERYQGRLPSGLAASL